MASPWTIVAMWIASALLLLVLCWPVGAALLDVVVRRRLRTKIHRDHVDWLARKRAQREERR